MSRGRIPEIRFSSFSNEWERLDLKSITKLITKGTTPKDKSGQGTINYIKVQNINSSSGIITIKNKISVEEHENYLKRSILEEGDILFSIAGTLGRTAVITKNMLPANTNQALAIIRLEKGNIDFVTTFLNGKAIKDFIKKNPTIGAQPNLSLKQVGNLKIEFPQINEQQKIGNLFKRIDENISLNQHALDLLKLRKKAFLQKTFPKKGENVPEFRFSGFIGNWRSRKLEEVISRVTREVPKPNESYGRLSIRSHAKGTFHKFVDDPNSVAMKNLYVVYENDLIVNITFAWEHAIAIAMQDDHGRLVSHRFPTFLIDNAHINFIEYIVTQESFRQKLELISPGGAGRNRVMNKKDFLKLKILIPEKLEEQEKIGNFFKNLDNSITLQEEKLESLKQMKKAFLQKMFV